MGSRRTFYGEVSPNMVPEAVRVLYTTAWFLGSLSARTYQSPPTSSALMAVQSPGGATRAPMRQLAPPVKVTFYPSLSRRPTPGQCGIGTSHNFSAGAFKRVLQVRCRD